MRWAPVALLVSLLAASGCGGDDRLSRAEYVREADAICEKYEKRLEEVREPQSLAEVPGYVDEARPVVEEGISELRDLEPPEDVQPKVDRWLSKNEQNLARIDDLSEAAEANDEQTVRDALGKLAENEEEADRLARDIGLRACAED